ncbi:unnamed protein product [Adineta ricciae]|uniref:G-protein coupled receptors family 2 profile 2 domain-containing protein n=1 Tax=Adineta ricciae TaxID=249248 RepID=A0A813VU31_ADIRI|nr:unnamed protein product [Adineta ricciae]
MNETIIVPLTVDNELYPALIQCFFIICCGYIAGQLNLLTTAHSIGLSRYISNFALPAVIFKNLVDVQFQSVSWQFLTSVLISKSILFLMTILLTYIVERPKNLASMGHYAIMTTQSNDFALILPIIQAVYKQSHPEYSRYIYLIAPISLVLLNPIGFILIETQTRLDDQRRHRGSTWSYFQLISTIVGNIARNPVVICTLLGVIFNQIFHQHVPSLIDGVLTPLAQSFTATALFYLGLTMVGRLNRLHARLVLTVFLLSMMKLVIFPLILRQAVFFLVKPLNGNLSYTLEYSNFGFLYGTSPTAPSVMFYVPESMLSLQAIASTELVVSTLLSGPIILVSAKMINLRTLSTKVTECYDMLLATTAYDVSILSLFCTIIVLIGFCLRHRWFKTSFIHKYTFIFVSLQMILSIWTIIMHHIKVFASLTMSPIFDLGTIFLALATRTWATSISIALMFIICHSNELARRCSWMYHIFGWIVPALVSLIIYFCSLIYQPEENPELIGAGKLGKLQIILSILLLNVCVLINTISLLRIARRTYQLRHDLADHRPETSNDSNSIMSEAQTLIDDNDEEMDTPFISRGIFFCLSHRIFLHIVFEEPEEVKFVEGDAQLFRHGILIALLTIDAVICVAVLLWLIISRDRDGIYYELQFLDTVLLYGQGIISFLVFALDADLLVPISRKLMKMFYCCGFSRNYTRNQNRTDATLDFEFHIRPEFIRHSR